MASGLVLCGIGAVPVVDWLGDSGLRLGDGIVCDDHLATSARGVWAAGDVAAVENGDGTVRRVEHWTAAEGGAVAGTNAAASLMGSAPTRYATVPYF